MLMFHLYYIGCVFVYLMYIYLSSEINTCIYLYLGRVYVEGKLMVNIIGGFH